MDQQNPKKQQISSKISQVIEQYIRDKGYRTHEVKYDNTARNFSSVAKRITIKGEREKSEETEYLFVKTLTDSDIRNERLKLSIKFERETFMYNTVFKLFKELQSEISLDKKFYFIKCIQAESNYLILEDMLKQQFEDVSHGICLDLDHVTLMIKELAKFHSFSFALKNKNRSKFDEVVRELKDIFVAPHRVKIVFENCWRFALKAITDEELRNKFICTESILDVASKPHLASKNGVICHGDYNLRNVLFKYDKARRPREMVMIDYQLCHYSSPVRDIFFLIASSISTELRNNHYSHLLEVYYTSLSAYLTLLDCDVKLCYPKEEFFNDFQEHFPSAFANSLVILRVLCGPEKSDEDIDKIYNNPKGAGSILEYNCSDAEKNYSERINGLIRHYAELKFI